MNKDLIKYGLIALGAYLLWKYIEDQGGLAHLFGTVTGGTDAKALADAAAKAAADAAANPTDAAKAAAAAAAAAAKAAADAQAAADSKVAATHQSAPALDLTGLVVSQDINDSLAGIVKINGVPVRFAIIKSTGGIYDNSGVEVSAQLAAQGVDINQLRAAFTAAAASQGLSGIVGWSRPSINVIPSWLM